MLLYFLIFNSFIAHFCNAPVIIYSCNLRNKYKLLFSISSNISSSFLFTINVYPITKYLEKH